MVLGGDAVAAFEVCEALVTVGSVAVGEVACEGVGEGVPVEVVGVLDDEWERRFDLAPLRRFELAPPPSDWRLTV